MSDSLHIVCPHCQSINRTPASKLADQPNCGRCRQPLFAGAPIELTMATFTRHVERSDIPLLVDFWAPWCGPCKMMAPQFQLATRFGIRSIPTLTLFQGGREIARQAGAMGAQDIVRWASSALRS